MVSHYVWDIDYIFKPEYVGDVWEFDQKTEKEQRINLGKIKGQNLHYFALKCNEKVLVKYYRFKAPNTKNVYGYVPCWFEPGMYIFRCLGEFVTWKPDYSPCRPPSVKVKNTYYLVVAPEEEKFKGQVILERLDPALIEQKEVFHGCGIFLGNLSAVDSSHTRVVEIPD